MILNIRGTNGSGKTTLARSFITENSAYVDLVSYKTEKGKDKTVIGYVHSENSVCVVGSYRTACGGMDSIPSFDLSMKSIDAALTLTRDVVAEGILCSTVYGSWALFAQSRDFRFAYMQTPIEICLERIRERIRARGKEVKFSEKLVRDKFKAISATRDKALRDKHLVYDLPYGDEARAAHDIVSGAGDNYRADDCR